MKITTGLLTLTLLIAAPQVEAQGVKERLSGVIKGNKKKGKGNKFTHLNEINDEYGISGSYTLLEPEQYQASGAYTTKSLTEFGLEFIKEKNGGIANELNWHYAKNESQTLFMVEPWKEKHNQIIFYKWISSSEYIEFIQLEPGVFAATTIERSLSRKKAENASTPRIIQNVLAKDPAKLEVYDKETAQAKVDMIMMSLNAEALEKEKEKLMAFKAYKENIGKVVFSDKLNTFNYRDENKPTEDPKNFKKELMLGGQTLFRAYLDKPVALSHPSAWYNISYELNGKKTSREGLRKTSSYFSKNIPQKTQYTDKHVTWVHSMIENNHGQVVWDIAFIELLYQNKDDFQIGKTYTLTVTLSAFMDGEDAETIATGTVNLKCTEESMKLLRNADTYNMGIYDKYEIQRGL